MNKTYKIYKKLLKYFGPQGWWPIAGVYNPEKTSFSSKEKFEIMAGAILTQNTAWSNVEKALANLRRANYLDIKNLSAINLKKLQRLIKPSGFYKQKAKRLKSFTNSIRHAGPIEKLTSEYLLSLNGIGPETADSILLYALEKPYFVVDAYTRRIVNRLGIITGEDYNDIQKFFKKNIPERVNIYKEYHALIVELAKQFCRVKPVCGGCPLSGDCAYGKKEKLRIVRSRVKT